MKGDVVYVTERALIVGIIKTTVIDGDEKDVWVVWPDGPWGKVMYRMGTQVHTTLEAAQARVQKMVVQKRAWLLKTLAKLDTIPFQVKDVSKP